MDRVRTSLRWSLFLAFAAAGMTGGCSQKITITQYPAFWTEDLKTIAVVPFRCTAANRQAGDAIAEQAARALAGNGTYHVFSRYDLKTIMDEKDLAAAMSGDAAASAKAFSKTNKVQGILTGTVTTYSATTRDEPKRDPIYAYDKRGNQYISGYKDWVQTTNQATVVVTAALIRPDGTTIHATINPAQGTMTCTSSEWAPPQMDPQTCLAAATQGAVARLVEEFAVTRQTITVSNDAFRTASDYYDGKFTFTDSFKVSDPKMLVVVELPACCDRNQFRITVVKGEERKDLVEVKLAWQRAWKSQSFEMSPKEIADKGGGPGTYTVKFYSGPEPIFKKTVYIR